MAIPVDLARCVGYLMEIYGPNYHDNPQYNKDTEQMFSRALADSRTLAEQSVPRRRKESKILSK